MKTRAPFIPLFFLPLILRSSLTPCHSANPAPSSLPHHLSRALEEGYRSTDPLLLQEAAWVLEDSLQRNPSNTSLRRSLAFLLLDRLHAPERALPHLQKIVLEVPEDAAWHTCLALALRALGKHEEATQHFRSAIAIEPLVPEPHYELANTLSSMGRLREALEVYYGALELGAPPAARHLDLAKTLMALGKHSEAALHARIVLQADPDHPEAVKILEATLFSPPQPLPPAPATIRPHRTGSVSVPPQTTSPNPWVPSDAALALAYRTKSAIHFKEAAIALEHTVHEDPQDLARRKTLAFVYLTELHRPKAALPHLQRIVQESPREGAWWELLAKAQTQTGDLQTAAASYRQAIACSRADVWLHYHLGRTLRKQGLSKQAIPCFQSALQIEPTNRWVQSELARCYLETAHPQHALPLAHALLQSDAPRADTHALLGDILRTQRDFQNAALQYGNALALQPSHPEALAGLDTLRSLQTPELNLSYYSFKDTEGFHQAGLFSTTSLQPSGHFKLSLSLHERFFNQKPLPLLHRIETRLGTDYFCTPTLQLGAGFEAFATDHRSVQPGAELAIYHQPHPSTELWVSQRFCDPVNESYRTVQEGFTQRLLSAGARYTLSPSVSLHASASQAHYSDLNTRRSGLANLQWQSTLPLKPTVELQADWLDYVQHSPKYPSPSDYTRIRPILALHQDLTDWLRLVLQGELSYVCDSKEWGSGIRAGIRFQQRKTFEGGLEWMKYQVPGAQSTWSGQGFKVDLQIHF